MSADFAERTQINGAPATIEELRVVATLNYGHFTSMQVRDGCAQGFDLHLSRLQRSTMELFGCALDVDATRGYLRHAINAAPAALSVRVNVFSRAFRRNRPVEPAPPDVLVTTQVAPVRPITPLRLKSVQYEREAPHIKHVGTFGLFHQRRLAQSAGFDDAVFVDASGAISEGTVWNIGFFDGDRIVWPDAPALDGISMQLLKASLHQRGVASVVRRIERADLGAYRSAFFTNTSCVACPIAGIDATAFAPDPALLALLQERLRAVPWQRI